MKQRQLVLSLLFLVFSFTGILPAMAQEGGEPAGHAESKKPDVAGEIFGHVSDSHFIHLFDINEHPVAIPLPVIAYSSTGGLSFFMSSDFGHEYTTNADGKKISTSAHGFHLEKGIKERLVADDGSKVYDLSITKSIVCMLLSIIILLWIMLSVAKKYKRNGVMTAPSGMQNALEPVITFIRDEVAKPNLGYKFMRFMPLLLTVFFFIWINNLLGLLPFGLNLTGNITVTLVLALISFVVMMANSNKHFWSHLLNPPGVPQGVKQLLILIEIMSLIIKPVALMIRLFANMLAGHIVILSVIMLIFIFGSALSPAVGWGFSPVSIAFAIFMFLLELLVAAIQAFIFTNLTAVFLGQAIEETHSEHHDHEHHGGVANEVTGQEYHISKEEIIA